MYFRTLAEQPISLGLIPIEKDHAEKTLHHVWAQSSVYVSNACNFFRIELLIIFVFDDQYKFLDTNLRDLPITEAILTSLAFEKLIKISYKKLGTKVNLDEKCNLEQ